MTDHPQLWEKISRVGLDALNEFEGSAERKQAGHIHGPGLSGIRSMQRMVKALCDHIDKLERRLTENPLKYRGVWKSGHYPPNSIVTHGGSCWHADKATDRRPGEGDWTLIVKRGADAK